MRGRIYIDSILDYAEERFPLIVERPYWGLKRGRNLLCVGEDVGIYTLQERGVPWLMDDVEVAISCLRGEGRGQSIHRPILPEGKEARLHLVWEDMYEHHQMIKHPPLRLEGDELPSLYPLPPYLEENSRDWEYLSFYEWKEKIFRMVRRKKKNMEYSWEESSLSEWRESIVKQFIGWAK